MSTGGGDGDEDDDEDDDAVVSDWRTLLGGLEAM